MTDPKDHRPPPSPLGQRGRGVLDTRLTREYGVRYPFVSAGMAIAAGLLLWLLMRARPRLHAGALLTCGVFYLAYIVYLAAVVLPSGAGAH